MLSDIENERIIFWVVITGKVRINNSTENYISNILYVSAKNSV